MNVADFLGHIDSFIANARACGVIGRRLLRDVDACAGPLLGASGLAGFSVLGRRGASSEALLLLECLRLVAERALASAEPEGSRERLGRVRLGTEAALPGAGPVRHPLLLHCPQLGSDGRLPRRNAPGHLLLAVARPVPVQTLHGPGTVLLPVLILILILPHGAKLMARIVLLSAPAAPHAALGAAHSAASGKPLAGHKGQHNA
jgi:hypothetical protein